MFDLYYATSPSPSRPACNTRLRRVRPFRISSTRLPRIRLVRLVLPDFALSVTTQPFIMSDQLYRILLEYTSREPTHLRGPIEHPRWRPHQRHFRNHRRQFPHWWGSGDYCRLFKSADPGFYSRPTLARVATPLPAFNTISQRLPTTLPEQPSFPQSTPLLPPPSCQLASTPIDLSVETPPLPPLRHVNRPYPFHPSFPPLHYGRFRHLLQRIAPHDRPVLHRYRRSRSILPAPRSCRLRESNPLDMTNDSVIFAHKFGSGFAALPSWALPFDQPGSRTQQSMPLRDERTLNRITILLRLLRDHYLTRKAHEQRALVTVPTSTTVRSLELRLISRQRTYSAFCLRVHRI